jgi:hypothetical protein
MKLKAGLGILFILTLVVSFTLIKNKTADRVTITAFYNQYACGDDNIDMKVQSVDNPHYKFILDKDIAPVTNVFDQSSLIDFVAEKTLLWQKGKAGEYLESFTLVGHFRDSEAKTECSATKDFVVDKIKYGKEKKFREF